MSAAPESRVLAPFGRRRLVVAGRREVGAYVVLTASDPQGPAPRPGQFYMLAAAERWGGGEDERPFVPRAFSVLRAGEDGLQFMLEAVGPGTARLCELGPGDGLWATGPLGTGFTAPAPGRRALLCGGGVGTAPLAIWQDELLEAGLPAPALLGFRDGPHAAGAELLANPRLATDDGSAGHHGLVTDLLAAELDEDAHAAVYACGPPAMLEAVRAMCLARGVPAQLALEAGMACGFGACYGCVVPVRSGGYVRLCVDGPVLDAALLEEVPAH
ncbi:MAG: dihydroorotate dehydrogenase electron transfer subunit [Solirubrobacteraceae bacterium]|nr:dihydroorotate dehydrogenase electron transfer subunit [Solirubrobacteraceae bacterium]